MPTAAENQFEIERRSILFKSTTSLPDESLLGYNGNPNNVVSGNSAGEFLLYNSPIGTSYIEDSGNLWDKTISPNTWVERGAGISGSPSFLGDYYTKSEVDAISASLQIDIDTKLDTSVFAALSGDTTDLSSYATISLVETVSGDLKAIIDTKLDTSVFAALSGTDLSSYATISYVESVSGNLQDQIDTKLDTSVFASISGNFVGSEFSIDGTDASTGYFTDKIQPGANITFTEEVSGGVKTLFINSNLDTQLWSNGIYGSQEIPVNDDSVRVSYGLSISGSGYPILSLVIPTSGDFLQVAAIYNSNTTGFDVQLSSPVRSTGYKINWTLNTSAQFDLSSLDQSVIPSQDITYDLGSPSKRWRDLYLSGNTMYIGSQTISVVDAVSGGQTQLAFGGQEIAVFDQDGALPLSALPSEIQSGLSFQDTIDPNTTTLPHMSGYTIGSFFIAISGGTLTDNISASFEVSEGDWALSNGTTWKKMPFKLPVRGITSAQIKEGAIQTDNIFPGAVTETKIANDSIGMSKLQSNVFDINNFSTNENDVNKVLRPNGSGGFTFGTVNLNVDDLEARVTEAENEATEATSNVQIVSAGFADLEANFNVVSSDVLALSAQVIGFQGQIDDKLDTSVFTSLSGQWGDVTSVQLSGISGNLETQINTKVNTTTLNAISGNLQGQVNNKLDTSVFAALSGGSGDVTSAQLASISGNLQTQINSKLDATTIVSVSGNTVLSGTSNLYVFVDTTLGAFSITLPNGVLGQTVDVIDSGDNASSNIITVSGSSIDGEPTTTIESDNSSRSFIFKNEWETRGGIDRFFKRTASINLIEPIGPDTLAANIIKAGDTGTTYTGSPSNFSHPEANVSQGGTGWGNNLVTGGSSFNTGNFNTNATTPYTITASSNYDASLTDWKAFDGNGGAQSHCWVSAVYATSWVKIQLDAAKIFAAFRIRAYSDPVYTPRDYKIQGSNNGSDWTDLKTVTGFAPTSAFEWGDLLTMDVIGSYLYYRLYATSNTAGNSFMALAEIDYREGSYATTTNTFQYRLLSDGVSTTFSPSTFVPKDENLDNLINGDILVEYSTDNGATWPGGQRSLIAFKALGNITGTSFWLRFEMVGSKKLNSLVINTSSSYAQLDTSGLELFSNGTSQGLVLTETSLGAIGTNIIPVSGGVYDLGSTSYPFENLYLNNVLELSDVTFTNTISAGSPSATGEYLKLMTVSGVRWLPLYS